MISSPRHGTSKVTDKTNWLKNCLKQRKPRDGIGCKCVIFFEYILFLLKTFSQQIITSNLRLSFRGKKLLTY